MYIHTQHLFRYLDWLLLLSTDVIKKRISTKKGKGNERRKSWKNEMLCPRRRFPLLTNDAKADGFLRTSSKGSGLACMCLLCVCATSCQTKTGGMMGNHLISGFAFDMIQWQRRHREERERDRERKENKTVETTQSIEFAWLKFSVLEVQYS